VKFRSLYGGFNMERPNLKARIFRWTLMVIGGISFAVAMAFLFGLFVKLLRNWIMPEIFGLPQITYCQSWGLVLLSHILFKLGGNPGHSLHPRSPDEHWKNNFRRQGKPVSIRQFNIMIGVNYN